MMLTSQQILDVVAATPSADLAGRLMYHRHALTTSVHGQAGRVSHDRLLADLAGQCAQTAAERKAGYRHPGSDPQVRRAQRSAGLSAADIAWLGRLPTDPAKVSYADAASLAAMAASLTGAQNASDARLVQSVWAPVREHHDAAAARADLAAAQVPTPPVPSSALRALTDAVAAEVPELEDAEACLRAGSQLRDTLDNRVGARQQKVLDARAAIARASEAAAVRTATTR